MGNSYLIISIIVVNLVVVGMLVAFNAARLRASGDDGSPPMSGSRRLIMGVLAFLGLVAFVTIISLYFIRQAGS